MLKIPHWRIAAAVVSLIAAAAIFYGVHKAWLACESPHKRAAMMLVWTNGCAEYWINRYQQAWSGLIATAATLAAAGVAWLAVQSQIGVQSDANRLAAQAFWQKKADESEAAIRALDMVIEKIEEVDRYIGQEKGEYPFFGATLNLWRDGKIGHIGYSSSPADYLILSFAKLEAGLNIIMSRGSAFAESTKDEQIRRLLEPYDKLKQRVPSAKDEFIKAKATAETMLQRLEIKI